MADPDKHEKTAKNPERDETAHSAAARKPLPEEIRARIGRPHKGDVGRAETNEEIFQGYKERELL